MENVNKYIEYALNAQPVEFKSAITDALNAKIADAIQMKKIEIGGSLFKDNEEEPPQEEDTFKLEDNLDEEL
jgi:hypothetical protein